MLTVQKQSGSNNKAPSRNGNQPYVMMMNHDNRTYLIANINKLFYFSWYMNA